MKLRRFARAVAAPLGFGAVAALGQAPFDLPVVMFLAFAAAIWLFPARWTPAQAALYGWAFGTGYFLISLRWIVSPFLVDVARHGWMAPFAVVLMSAGLALFWGGRFGARVNFRGAAGP